MAAKSWEVDFRYPAIMASLDLIRDGYLDDPFRCPGSFCIPITARPAMRWSPGKLSLVFLVLGFAGAIAGAVIASNVDQQGPNATLWLILAATCSLSGLGMFFVPLKCDKWILRTFLGQRGNQFYDLAGHSPVMCSELSKGDSSTLTLSIDADDHVLIAFDEDNRRVIMEGIAARYQIRSADVLWIEKFEVMNYVGVELCFQINPETNLRLAVARPSLLKELIRQAPILFFLKSFVSQKIYQRFSETLTDSPVP